MLFSTIASHLAAELSVTGLCIVGCANVCLLLRALEPQPNTDKQLQQHADELSGALTAGSDRAATWAGVMDQFTNCNDPAIRTAAVQLQFPYNGYDTADITTEHIKAHLVRAGRHWPGDVANLTDIFEFTDMAGEHAVTLHNNYTNTQNGSGHALAVLAQHLTTRDQAHSAARLSTNWHGSIQELAETAAALAAADAVT